MGRIHLLRTLPTVLFAVCSSLFSIRQTHKLSLDSLKALTIAIASQVMKIDIINDFFSRIFGIKSA